MIRKAFAPGIHHPNYIIRRRLLQAIRNKAGMLTGRIMDLGCGSKPYRDLFQASQYVGVDYEGPGHSHLNESIDVFYDGKSIPFEGETFDAVFSSEVFEHVFNLDEVVGEINRVLRTGGHLLVTCPFAICEHETPNDFARYSSYGLRHILENNGFRVLFQDKTGNSVETIFQLWIMYVHQHITPYLGKIPVVRSAFRTITYSCLNLLGIALGKLLPDRKDLYLNNVVLCIKTGPAA